MEIPSDRHLPKQSRLLNPPEGPSLSSLLTIQVRDIPKHMSNQKTMNGNANHRSPRIFLRSTKTKEDTNMSAAAADDCSHALLNTDINSNNNNKTSSFFPTKPSFMNWSMEGMVHVARYHSILCAFALSLFFFMSVEYTLSMVPPSSPPFDVGFQLTQRLHNQLSARPALNTLLAAFNTVFVGMQTTYILWAWLVEGRPRATISALFMFTCRGILGYSTQLPLPQEFLGSGADFPVGNVSFFLFFSGHVAGAVIASLDMRRMHRHELAWTFDMLNMLQGLRLLVTRGHYTIDLAVGVGAGVLFDSLAGKYEDSTRMSLHLSYSKASNGFDCNDCKDDAITTVQHK